MRVIFALKREKLMAAVPSEATLLGLSSAVLGIDSSFFRNFEAERSALWARMAAMVWGLLAGPSGSMTGSCPFVLDMACTAGGMLSSSR